MTTIDTKNLREDQAYEARGIVARINVIGHYGNALVRMPVYQLLTIDPGPGRDKFAVKYLRLARIDEAGFLDTTDLQEGDIVVDPGIVYRKTPWSTKLMNKHLAALRNYRPKVIVKSEVDTDAKPIDLGAVNAPPT